MSPSDLGCSKDCFFCPLNLLEPRAPILQPRKVKLTVELWACPGSLSHIVQDCTEVTSGASVGGKGPGDERAKPDPCFTLLFTFTEIFSRPGQVFPVSHRVSAEDHVSVCSGLGVRGWRYVRAQVCCPFSSLTGSYTLRTAPQWTLARSWRCWRRPMGKLRARCRGCWAGNTNSPWMTSCRCSSTWCRELGEWEAGWVEVRLVPTLSTPSTGQLGPFQRRLAL